MLISEIIVDEMELVGDQMFPYEQAVKVKNLAKFVGSFDQDLTMMYYEGGDERFLLLVDDDQNIASISGFFSRLNGKVWQAKQSATYDPYTGRRLVGKMYKYAKEQLKKSIQSDITQTYAGKKLWTKIIPSLGLTPMILDTETEHILDPNKIDRGLIYPDDSSPVLHRYCWVLERFDHYPTQNLLKENSLFVPITGLWYI
jgi:hypothetical protein